MNVQIVVSMLLFGGALMACNALTGADDLSMKSASRTRSAKQDAAAYDDDDDSDPSGSSARPTDVTADAGAATDAAAANPTFLDDFNRANGAIGNGWIERASGAYGINGGAVVQAAEGPPPSLLVLRPQSEEVADVEVSASIRFPKAESDPGIYARIQNTAPNQLSAYSFYLWSPTEAEIAREDLTQTTPLARFTIAPPLNVGDTVKLVFRVTGDSAVTLAASVVDGAGALRGSTTFQDSTASRIARPGSVGFGGPDSAGARYDDFKRVTLLSP